MIVVLVIRSLLSFVSKLFDTVLRNSRSCCAASCAALSSAACCALSFHESTVHPLTNPVIPEMPTQMKKIQTLTA